MILWESMTNGILYFPLIELLVLRFAIRLQYITLQGKSHLCFSFLGIARPQRNKVNNNNYVSKVLILRESKRWMGRSSFVFPAKRIACFKIRFKIAVQYTARKIPFMFFFSGNFAASVSISTFTCLGENYIFPGSVHIFPCSRIGRPILQIYKSLTNIWV